MMDCGPACLKMICKFYGKYFSLQHLRDLCGITKEGVSALDLTYACESLGLKSLSVKCSVDDLLEKIPLPVIIHWDNSHFIVVYKTHIKKRKIYVADPAKGYIEYSAEEFQKKWYKREEEKGVLIAIEPQASFYEKTTEQYEHRQKTLETFLGYLRPYKKNFITLL